MKDLLKMLVFGSIFLIPFLPVYVENDFFFPYITGKNFAFRIIVEVMFASWVLLALFDKKYRPKFSWMFAGFASLLIVMFFADLFGEYPLKSFWSNFERMDGYVTLVHIFLLMVVMGSVMKTEKLWRYFFYVSTSVALFVALYGLAQMSGMADGWTGRLDSRLGNSAYMAVYMLFHLFMVAWLIVRSNNRMVWIMGGVVLVLMVYVLILTGTRGTFLGFVGGSAVTVGYIALFGRRYPHLRTYAIWGILAMVILSLGFIAVKDSDFVQNSPMSRIANTDISRDLEIRSVIWSMALEGVKQRPVLGWGQGNFNYVFNAEYDPVLWGQEQWFDRVHNIVLDWLIAGGVLGFLAYVSIFVALAYYLVWLPYFKNDQRIDVLERAVIVGLLVGYLMHNLVVFDNIISYIFFACIIALVHYEVGEDIEAVEKYELEEKVVAQIVTPIVLVCTVATVYFVNVPGMQASGDIINAMRAQTVEGRLEQFHTALSRGSFANQEIVEQLAQQAMGVANNQQVPEDERKMMIQRAELELLKLSEEKPGDARLHNFLSSFYRSIGAYPQAQEQGALARKFSPRKQGIIMEQAVTELQLGNKEAARDFFKEAFELDTTHADARIFYAATEVNLGNVDKAKELLGDEYVSRFALNDFALNTVYQSGNLEFLAELFEERVKARPGNAQDWASLSYAYYELDETQLAIDALTRAASSVPEFAPRAQCFIANIEAGNEPTTDCDGTTAVQAEPVAQ